MGASVGTLLTLAILFTGTLMMFRAALLGHVTINDAMKESTQLEGERALTALSITSTDADNLFRCDTKAVVNLENIGEVPIADFDEMDILTWYTPETGDPLTKRFTYSTGNLEKGEWNLDILPPGNGSGAWDPGETASFVWRFLQPQKEGTLGYVTVGAPNGVFDSDYLNFTNTISGDCRFLHNNPTPPAGDTASQAVLPVDTGMPVTATLYNYDTDRDSDPGLRLQETPNGLDETSPDRYQVWRTGVLTSSLVVTGDVLIDLWAALTPPNTGEIGVVIAYLRDYDGATYTEIGDGAVFARDWQSGSDTFVERLALVQGINYTIPVGHQLEVRVIVDDASQQDMVFAYDTDLFSSLLQLSFVPPAPTTSLYLHNNPTPPTEDTARQPFLPLDATVPTATTLYQYGLPNNNPGLLLKGAINGLSETDPEKYQVWRTGPLASPLAITGDVYVDLWAAIRQFQSNQSGAATMYLRDYDGSTHTEIGNGSIFAFDWQEGSSSFVKRTIMIPDVDYTVPAGHELEARLITDTIKTSKDMWLAYDTTSYQTVIKLP